ncbi:MAG TPA: CcoQ/FixQ family Cbb3-type cytochrome c oxidase assembly chaperone [Noviherbaspirillum sp.]|jgi:cytochrome c oxidase cbb3-type subunit 4|uniref:cbb3-type cytochrome oxidase subunit 3 n=1 Tax=Noviherbaspirillum sp. TaxID=1926288 RepID=UPI002DDD3051|nr:CcoQ/FixQ family Cbb3-type cytochrome c oxidase assembly chaperone [Noviherbaspirillum sp.]HEV2609518.1 CcoQ/FixQ family Cbb3-type cytochrome c oxidase assembly chaperone [Noviherbaspirillum sp.]
MAIELLDIRSLVTVASFITFLGIILWSYSARRKPAFEQAAYLPFADEQDESNASPENRHG